MKTKPLIFKGLIVSGLMFPLCLGLGCKEEQVETRPIKIYTLTKLAPTATKMAANNLRGVTASEDGSFIYLIGESKASLVSYDIDQSKWDHALGDWKSIKTAKDEKATIDLSAYTVGSFAASPDGLLFTLDGHKGLVIVKGSGAAHSMHYQQGVDGFASEPYVPKIVTNSGGERFIYLFPAKNDKEQMPKDRNILFRKYVSPGTADAKKWKTAVKGTAASPIFWARTADNNKGLLLAGSANDGVSRLKDIGMKDTSIEKSVYAANNFMLDGQTKNDHINTMALVANKFLVLGFKSTNDKDGGVAYADITESKPKWKTFGAGLNVDSIAIEHIRRPQDLEIAAVITTDKGYLFFNHKGEIMELVPNKGHLVNSKYIEENRMNNESYDKAKTGFAGDHGFSAAGVFKGAAQGKTPEWYLGVAGKTADDNGTYTLDIKIDYVAKKVPADLP